MFLGGLHGVHQSAGASRTECNSTILLLNVTKIHLFKFYGRVRTLKYGQIINLCSHSRYTSGSISKLLRLPNI